MEQELRLDLSQHITQLVTQQHYEIAPQVTQLEVAADDATARDFFSNFWSSIADATAQTTLWLGGESGAGKGTVIGQLIQLIEKAKENPAEDILPEVPDNLQIQTASLGQAIYFARHILQPGDANFIQSPYAQYKPEDYRKASRVIATWRHEFFEAHSGEPCLFLAEGPLFTHPELDQTWSALNEALHENDTRNRPTFLLGLLADEQVQEQAKALRRTTSNEELSREAQKQSVVFDQDPEDMLAWRETRGTPEAVAKVRTLIDNNIINNIQALQTAATTPYTLRETLAQGITIEALRRDTKLRKQATRALYEWLAYDATQLDMAAGYALIATNTVFDRNTPLQGYSPISVIPYYESRIQRYAAPYRRRTDEPLH